MSKFKVGDRVAVYATVVEVADFDARQRVNIEFREGKATRWFPDADLRLVTIRKLRDPVVVHVAMLRGDIAVPPLAEMLHIYGATFSDAETANIELAKARETIRQLTERTDAAEHQNRNYALIIDALGKRAEAAERELQAVRDAPTVATVVQAPGPYELRELQVKRCISHLSDSCFLPPIGTELIARPARKDGE